MPFDPEQFLALAHDLARTDGAGEAAFRSAISRAYYAVFLKARASLEHSGQLQPTYTGRDHALIIAALRADGGAQGDQLDKLRQDRARADYRLNLEMTRRNADDVLFRAQHLIKRV